MLLCAAAAALKCMGGSLQGRLWPRNEDEARRAKAAGYDVGKILHTEDLVKVGLIWPTGRGSKQMCRATRTSKGIGLCVRHWVVCGVCHISGWADYGAAGKASPSCRLCSIA